MTEEKQKKILSRKSVFIFDNETPRKSQSNRKESQKLRNKSIVLGRYSMMGHFIEDRPPNEPIFQPTYRLVSQRPLNLERINKILKESVNIGLINNAFDRYSSTNCNRFCENISKEIQFRIAGERFDRFRLICVVTIAEKTNASMVKKLGFTWDVEQDQWIKYVCEKDTFFLIAWVACVYWE